MVKPIAEKIAIIIKIRKKQEITNLLVVCFFGINLFKMLVIIIYN